MRMNNYLSLLIVLLALVPSVFAAPGFDDDDSDGIDNDIDLEPSAFSNDFQDTGIGGGPGAILSRGSQNLRILHNDDTSVPPDNFPVGTLLEGLLVVGLTPAQVQVCNGEAIANITTLDQVVMVCESVVATVLQGIVEIQFIIDGLPALAAATASATAPPVNVLALVGEGNTLAHDIGTTLFTAPATNAGPVTVMVEDVAVLVEPGETLQIFVPVRDSFLRGGAQNTNEGANPRLRVQQSGSNRALVDFGPVGVPVEQVTEAKLALTIAENGNNWNSGRTVTAHRLLEPWTEGHGWVMGNPSPDRGTGQGVTWNCATDEDISDMASDCATEWDGGAFAAETAPGVLHTNGLAGKLLWDVTEDVRTGVSAGWLVRKNTAGTGQIEYHSLDGAAVAGDGGLLPLLLVKFTTG